MDSFYDTLMMQPFCVSIELRSYKVMEEWCDDGGGGSSYGINSTSAYEILETQCPPCFLILLAGGHIRYKAPLCSPAFLILTVAICSIETSSKETPQMGM